MRVTWTWTNRPDDESVEQAVHHCSRTTGKNSIEDDTTQRPTPPPRHHIERNTRHV